MNFTASTTSYFDIEAKRLSKRYKSFADDYDSFLEEIKNLLTLFRIRRV